MALGRVARYAIWRRQPAGLVPELDGTADAVGGPGAGGGRAGGARTARSSWTRVAARALLATHGIDAVEQRLVDGADEALAAAQEIGYPVALKAPGLARPAKTEAGGVAVDVHGDDELRRAFVRMAELHGDAMRPALVQAMARSGIDVELVVRQHPVFGSVLALGPAGTGQLEQRIVPLTDVDAERLLEGLPDLDPEAGACLADLVLRLSALAVAVPELVEARLDPVLVARRQRGADRPPPAPAALDPPVRSAGPPPGLGRPASPAQRVEGEPHQGDVGHGRPVEVGPAHEAQPAVEAVGRLHPRRGVEHDVARAEPRGPGRCRPARGPRRHPGPGPARPRPASGSTTRRGRRARRGGCRRRARTSPRRAGCRRRPPRPARSAFAARVADVGQLGLVVRLGDVSGQLHVGRPRDRPELVGLLWSHWSDLHRVAA